jgi:hypothetical protein
MMRMSDYKKNKRALKSKINVESEDTTNKIISDKDNKNMEAKNFSHNNLHSKNYKQDTEKLNINRIESTGSDTLV